MKKRIQCAFLAGILLFPTFLPSELEAQTEIGLGYQSILAADIVHSVSARAWFEKSFGVQLGAFVAHGAADDYAGAFIASVRALYAPVHNYHSCLYVGLEVSYGIAFGDLRNSGEDPSLVIFSPFFGAEFHFSEIPELGFNWDIAYRVNTLSAGGADFVLRGTVVSMGVHFYFARTVAVCPVG